MRHFIVFLFVSWQALMLVTASEAVARDQLPPSHFIADEVLISLKPDPAAKASRSQFGHGRMGVSSIDTLHASSGVSEIKAVFGTAESMDPLAVEAGLPRIFKLRLSPGVDVFAALESYRAHPDVEFAELNIVYSATVVPSDTRFAEQWALHNAGQSGGRRDADIDAPEAWDLHRGAARTIIAIVDTGIDYRHPELAGRRMLRGRGHDFVNDDDDPMDDHGHGTYVAGIAAANSNNRRGVAGICWGCSIIPIKVLDAEGRGTSEWVAQGIRHAAQSGARIINMSLGYEAGCGCSRTVASAINYAWSAGSFIVAASGNDSNKSEISYPAASPRVFAVGASDHNDEETDFSNRSNKVDLLAPGAEILGIDIRPGEEPYGSASGTSAAAPHVAGVAALLWSARPTLTNAQVWRILRASADRISGAVPRRLNAYKALNSRVTASFATTPDRCNGEPDCPFGCGAEIAFAPEPSFADLISMLRDLRDATAGGSALGRSWSDLYEEHKVEVAWILLRDADFRAEVRSHLQEWLVIARGVLGGDEASRLTVRQVASARAVFDGFEARGGTELRGDLEHVRRDLEAGGFLAVGASTDDLRRKLAIRR